MFHRPVVRCAVLGLCLFAAGILRAATPTPAQVDIRGDNSSFDYASRTMIVTGSARLQTSELVLTADEMRYQQDERIVHARGHFVIIRRDQRLVADEGEYHLDTGRLRVTNLRLGRFPFYLSGASVEGTLDELVFTDATLFFREEAGYVPSLHARRVTYRQGRLVEAEGLRVGLMGSRFITLPRFEHDLSTQLISYFNAFGGYRNHLGLFGLFGARVPVGQGFKVGGDLGLYTRRGVMIGPGAEYSRQFAPDHGVAGSLRTGYINDRGDRLTDVLGSPVPANRQFAEWHHHQTMGANDTFDGQFYYWSDSEVARDFQSKDFFRVQQPDSFLEATHTTDNTVVSLFTRLHPNRYHRVQERLPELRVDLLPSPAPLGFTQRFFGSFAVLQEDAWLSNLAQRSTRFDAYYGLERTLALAPWFSFTPVVGGRVTHYAQATGGKLKYTRVIGEIGFDASLRGSGTFDYRNAVWEIDGLRHLIEPRLSYRYAPEAGDGRAWIPSIDRRVFTTYLEPLSIADQRHVDDLERLDTLRLSLANTLQTRDPEHGSRDLLSLDLAADYRFSRKAGQEPLSNLHTSFALTPAPWLKLELYQRLGGNSGTTQKELNYALTVTDQHWWSARLSSYFLKNDYEEYGLEVTRRLNEVCDVFARWRYDSRRSRFNEQTYGVAQRIGQTWDVRYEVSMFEGPRRESSFSFNLEVELIKF